jgi:hypothetical protein
MSNVIINPYIFVGANGVDVTVVMTSDTAPSGTTSAHTVHVTQNAWLAMDGASTTTHWHSTTTGGVGWWQYEFAAAKTIYEMRISASSSHISHTGFAPEDFTIEGSNDGASYDTLLTVTGETSWTSGEERSFDLTSQGSYTHYKIDVTATASSTYLAIGAVQFFT